MFISAKLSKMIFAIPFAIFGLFHFMNGSKMAGMVPSFIPGGVFWVYLTGIALLGAAVSIIMEKQVKLVASLLGFMMLGFVLLVHLPGTMNEATMQMAMPSLLKDISLAGAAFLISANAKS